MNTGLKEDKFKKNRNKATLEFGENGKSVLHCKCFQVQVNIPISESLTLGD